MRKSSPSCSSCRGRQQAIRSDGLRQLRNLTSYKRPSEIIVLDALPATSTGKILKHKLAESPAERVIGTATPRIRNRQI
mgnify:CR=1 FL=1